MQNGRHSFTAEFILESGGMNWKIGTDLYTLLMCVCLRSHFSHVQLCATLWTVAHQAPLPMGFSKQEYWSGLPCPPPGHLPNPGIELRSPALGQILTDGATGKPIYVCNGILLSHKKDEILPLDTVYGPRESYA